MRLVISLRLKMTELKPSHAFLLLGSFFLCFSSLPSISLSLSLSLIKELEHISTLSLSLSLLLCSKEEEWSVYLHWLCEPPTLSLSLSLYSLSLYSLSIYSLYTLSLYTL